MTKCIDNVRRRSPSGAPNRALVPRMTGVGCYGKPAHIAQTLARVLTRFGLTPADLLSVDWRPASNRGGCGNYNAERQGRIPGGAAVVMLSQYGRVKGFFLWAAEGRPRLHVHIHSTGKADG